MNPYLSMRERHRNDYNNFPWFFAFNDKQFYEGLGKLGLGRDEVEKVTSIGHGGYCRKSDVERLYDMGNKHKLEIAEAMKGEYFAEQALTCELANHEYNYTGDATDALMALGLSEDLVNKDPVLSRALRKAIAKQGDPF